MGQNWLCKMVKPEEEEILMEGLLEVRWIWQNNERRWHKNFIRSSNSCIRDRIDVFDFVNSFIEIEKRNKQKTKRKWQIKMEGERKRGCKF